MAKATLRHINGRRSSRRLRREAKGSRKKKAAWTLDKISGYGFFSVVPFKERVRCDGTRQAKPSLIYHLSNKFFIVVIF